jgi:hypothetical protein
MKTIIENASDQGKIRKQFRKRKRTDIAHVTASVRTKSRDPIMIDHHGQKSLSRRKWKIQSLHPRDLR